MRTMVLFMMVSFDGKYKVSSGDIHWNDSGDESNAIAVQQTSCMGRLCLKTGQNGSARVAQHSTFANPKI